MCLSPQSAPTTLLTHSISSGGEARPAESALAFSPEGCFPHTRSSLGSSPILPSSTCQSALARWRLSPPYLTSPTLVAKPFCPSYPHSTSVLFWKKRGEEALQRSGLSYTIVRPGGLKSKLEQVELRRGHLGHDMTSPCMVAPMHPRSPLLYLSAVTSLKWCERLAFCRGLPWEAYETSAQTALS